MNEFFQRLVWHLVHDNLDEIVAKSKMHCHVRNVHSIMLLEAPGKTIRLFIAEENHPLHLNHPSRISEGMSVGFHPHHCDITLTCVQGLVVNWTVEEASDGIEVGKFKYDSKLLGGSGGFLKIDTTYVCGVERTYLPVGGSVALRGSELHTMDVAEGERAAWLVFEGKEDPAYSPVCLSTSNLESTSTNQLYYPMERGVALRLLKEVGLL